MLIIEWYFVINWLDVVISGSFCILECFHWLYVINRVDSSVGSLIKWLDGRSYICCIY